MSSARGWQLPVGVFAKMGNTHHSMALYSCLGYTLCKSGCSLVLSLKDSAHIRPGGVCVKCSGCQHGCGHSRGQQCLNPLAKEWVRLIWSGEVCVSLSLAYTQMCETHTPQVTRRTWWTFKSHFHLAIFIWWNCQLTKNSLIKHLCTKVPQTPLSSFSLSYVSQPFTEPTYPFMIKESQPFINKAAASAVAS